MEGIYTVEVTGLKDPVAKQSIPRENVSPGGKFMGFVKDKEKVVTVTVKYAVPSGLYYGSLILKNQSDSTCTKKITLCLNALDEKIALAAISASGMPMSINTVNGRFLNGLLPVKERRNGLAIPFENTSIYPASIDRIVLELVGTNSQEVVRPVITLDSTERTIHAYQKKLVAISLRDVALLPDEYTGKVQIYLKNSRQPLDTPVTVYRRCSVVWALFLLLLGIGLGGIYFLVKSKKVQTDYLQRVLRLRNEINGIGDEVSKKEMLLTVRSLLYGIENAETEEEKTALEEKIKALKTAMAEINELEIVVARLAERMGEVPAAQSELLNHWRDAILQGDPEKKAAAKLAFEQSLSSQGTSRGSGGAEGMSVFGVRASKARTEEAAPKEAESKLQQLLAGRFSVMFIFTYLRPFVWFISLLILTMIGLQQIYLNGSPSFGTEGFYDYLKLLSWGAFSNIATGSIIDNPLLNKFSPETQTEG